MAEFAKRVVRSLLAVACTLVHEATVRLIHIRCAVLQLCPDPIVMHNRNGICILHTKLEQMIHVLIRAINDAEASSMPHGGLNKRLFRSCKAIMRSYSSKRFDEPAVVGTAAVTSQLLQNC